MITVNQRTLIQEAVNRYAQKHSSISFQELSHLAYSLKPTSRKTGKPIRFNTFAMYELGSRIFTKSDIILAFELILRQEMIHHAGFFN